MKELIRHVWEALFLNDEPFAEMCDRPQPALRGLSIVVVVAVAVALVGLVGTTLEWATSPRLADVQRVVLQGLKKMEWYQELVEADPELRENFQHWFDLSWKILPPLLGAPNIPRAALRIILLPLGLGIAWLVYGVLAYLFARLLGGRGGLGPTLGCTALAIAPQVLNLVTFFPYVALGGLVGTWTLLGRYLAVKTCHRLTWSRALVAALLPYMAFGVVTLCFACLGIAVLGAIFGGGMTR